MRFNRLPVEIQFDVFATISAENLCTKVAPVCRRWRKFAYESKLWKDIHLNSVRHNPNLITHILSRAPFINRLELFYIDDFSWLRRLPVLKSLREMRFHACGFSDEILTRFLVVFPCLQRLDVGHPKLATVDFSVRLFTRWNCLTDLYVRCAHTLDVDLATIGKECKNLVRLSMSLELETESSFVEFLNVRGPHLQRLDLCGLRYLSSKAYQSLGQCLQLTHLVLSLAKNLTDEHFIEFIMELKALEYFSLSGSDHVFSTDFASLSANKSFPSIGEVFIYYCCNFNAVAVNILAKCGLFKTLITSPQTSQVSFNDCVSIANTNGLQFIERENSFILRRRGQNKPIHRVPIKV